VFQTTLADPDAITVLNSISEQKLTVGASETNEGLI